MLSLRNRVYLFLLIKIPFSVLATSVPQMSTSSNLDPILIKTHTALYEKARRLITHAPERALEATLDIPIDSPLPNLQTYRSALLTNILLRLGVREQKAKHYIAAYALFRSAGPDGQEACKRLSEQIPECALPLISCPNMTPLQTVQAIALAHYTLNKLQTLTSLPYSHFPPTITLQTDDPVQIIQTLIAYITVDSAVASYLYSVITLEPHTPQAKAFSDAMRLSERDDYLQMHLTQVSHNMS